MSFLATTGGIRSEDVRDLMVAAVEHRFGRVNRLPVIIEWLSDNGGCYIAGDTLAASPARSVSSRERHRGARLDCLGELLDQSICNSTEQLLAFANNKIPAGLRCKGEFPVRLGMR